MTPERQRRRWAISLPVMLAAGFVLLMGLATIANLAPDGSILRGASTAILYGLLLLAGPVGVIATAYLTRLWWKDRPRTHHPMGSWVLLLFMVIATILTIAALFIGGLSMRRLAGYPPLEWSASYTLALAVMILFIPAVIATVFWTQRRGRGDNTPPPMND